MKRLLLVAVAVNLLLFTGAAFAQEHQHEHGAAPTKGAKLEKAYLQQVWDAWCTLDAKNAAKYYGKGADHVFFDIAPLKYAGWAEYEKGVTPFLNSLKSAKARFNDDVQIHHEGNIAWSIATLNLDMVEKTGKSSTLPIRWTAIWHNHGANWVIAHDHVSAPMPEEAPKQ